MSKIPGKGHSDGIKPGLGDQGTTRSRCTLQVTPRSLAILLKVTGSHRRLYWGRNVIRLVFQHQRGAFGWEVEAGSGFYGHSGGGRWWPDEVTAERVEKGDDL